MQSYKITEYTIWPKKKKKIEQLQKRSIKEISPFSRSRLSKEMILINEQQFMQLYLFHASLPQLHVMTTFSNLIS